MRAYVVDAKPEHIKPVAENMRSDDVSEIWAANKNRPESALRCSLALSPYCKTIMVDDQPAGIFGVNRNSVLTKRGTPWLLGNDLMESISFRFLRHSKKYVGEMFDGFEYLENWVDARNTLSIAWLQWLGFVIMPAKPYGHLALPFHHFYMER